MNEDQYKRHAQQILRNAVLQSVAHPVDDEDVLFRLMTGDLTEVEREDLHRHATTCEYCAYACRTANAGIEESADHSKPGSGSVQPTIEQLRAEVTSRQSASASRKSQRFWLLTAAACILLLIPVSSLVFSSRNSVVQFATVSSLADFGLSPRIRSKGFPLQSVDQGRLEQLRALAESDPDAVDPGLELAFLLFQSGQTAEARDILLRLQRIQPGDGIIRNALGLMEFQLQNFSQARMHFQEAQSDSRIRLAALINEADTLLAGKQKNDAIEVLKNGASSGSQTEQQQLQAVLQQITSMQL